MYWKSYLDVDGDWIEVGVTPLEDTALPMEYLRWRFVKEGYRDKEVAAHGSVTLGVSMVRESSATDGMVRLSAAPTELASGETLNLEAFWLDRHEVTNAEYKQFVDAGGYVQPEYWKHRFVDGSRTLTWEQAMTRWRDRTGRPGPSTWELGSYPEGQDSYPVQGVSWYEAAAYAEYVGKSLPTVYHWHHAALGQAMAATSTRLANLVGTRAVPVGTSGALDPYGTVDLAGNVKEWCLNASGENRYIAGGSWEDPAYLFTTDVESRSPFERLPTHGFRCAKYEEPITDEAAAPVDVVLRDYSMEQPVDDEVFEVFRSIYAYDATPLDARVERLETDATHYRAERVTFKAAYGDETVPADFYAPTSNEPPYQTVVLFPASDALHVDTADFYDQYIDFIVRSGRACLLPIYKGTFTRRMNVQKLGANEQRDVLIQMYKDLGRSTDYLTTRTDVDASRLAFFGVSLGARFGPLFTAVDDRFAASVLVAGGLYQGGEFYTIRPMLPEMDPFHFAPRSTTPTLMINGRNDFIRPLETHQVPFFELLGASVDDKRHAVFDSGHIPPRLDTIRETLDWLDKYLGPVNRSVATQ